MATIVEQLYSQTHWGGVFDGTDTIWNFSFSGGYIFPEHVKAYYVDQSGARVELVVTPSMLIGPFQLRVIAPKIPATAQRFVIYRNTPKDLPLVDFETGARVTEANLDRIAQQAVFIAAEVLDGSYLDRGAIDLSPYGFKGMWRNTYTGASTVQPEDNGKAHYKTDGTGVTVPADMADTQMTTIINNSASSMTVTVEQTTYRQGATVTTIAPDGTFTILPRGTATVLKISDTECLVSGALS